MRTSLCSKRMLPLRLGDKEKFDKEAYFYAESEGEADQTSDSNDNPPDNEDTGSLSSNQSKAGNNTRSQAAAERLAGYSPEEAAELTIDV